MRKPKKQEPTVYSFFGEAEWAMQKEWSREFSKTSGGVAKVMLYRVNTVVTKSHSLYGETKVKNKKFLSPIELQVSLSIEEIKTEYVSKGGIFKETVNGFTFGVYLDELEEKSVGINKGDFVKHFDGEKYHFYEVSFADNIKSNNSLMGYKPIYMLVHGIMVLDNVIMED